MFDLLSKNEDADNQDGDDTDIETEEPDDDDEITEEEKQEVFAELEKEETKQISPIYTQYTDIQKKYPDCVIAYRLGDFYEILGNNASEIANILDLTLTGRDVGLESRIPMIGFPYHVADKYIGKLISKGYKVAVVEKTNEITIKQDNMRIDMQTGEILQNDNNALTTILKELFGNAMEIRL